MTKSITSRDNPLVKRLLRLAGSPRQRRKAGRALLEGAHLVSAYRERLGPPETVVASESGLREREVAALFDRCDASERAIVPQALLQELSGLETAPGILAVVAVPNPTGLLQPGGLTLLLENVQDPGNVGSILRCAAAVGAARVYLSAGCADPWSPKVLRAGMGAQFALAVYEHADLEAVARGFPGRVVAAVAEGGRSLFELDLRGTVGLVIGSEGAGISPDLLAQADEAATVPTSGRVESLNAAAAAAVCCFEKLRQDLTGPGPDLQ